MKEFKNFNSAKISFFRCGGNIDVFCIVNNITELQFALNKYKQYKDNILPLGAGSNILIRDSGFHGLCIKLAGDFLKMDIKSDNCGNCDGFFSFSSIFSPKKMANIIKNMFKNNIFTKNNGEYKIITAGAGAFAKSVSQFALKNNLIGAEFMDTIPGTVGGLTRMNAGCFNSEIKDIFHSATILVNNKIKIVKKHDMCFSYRNSFLPKNAIIINVNFKLKTAINEKQMTRSRQLILDMQNHRKNNQIVGFTCGSTFANDTKKNISAWKMIDKVGLRGYKIGGAQFSEKHCNFIVNSGTATATDIENLIILAQKKVRDKFGINLKLEVKII